MEYILILAFVGIVAVVLYTAQLAANADIAMTTAICRLFESFPDGDADCGGTGTPTGQPQFACVRSSFGAQGNVRLNVSFVQLGGGEGFLVEELSDGTYRVTWVNEGEGGVSGSPFEAGASVTVGGREFGLEAGARAEAVLTGRNTDSRVFRSEDDAMAYLRERLADETINHLPHGPREVAGVFNHFFGPDGPDGDQGPATSESGIRIGGTVTGTAGPLNATAQAIGRGGVRTTALPDGGQIVTVVLQGEAGIAAGVPVIAEFGPRGARSYAVSLRLNAQGEPVALRVTGEASGTLRPGLVNTRKLGQGFLEELGGALRASDTNRTVVDYELALDTPERRGAALQFLADAPRPGEDVGDAAAQRRNVEQLWGDHGQGVTVAVRQYDDQEASFGMDAKLRALGIVGGGGHADLTGTRSNLREAHFWDTTNGGFVPWSACTG